MLIRQRLGGLGFSLLHCDLLIYREWQLNPNCKTLKSVLHTASSLLQNLKLIIIKYRALGKSRRNGGR